jgi:hypothetical protein
MLLEQHDRPVNPPPHCGQPGDGTGTTPKNSPKHLVIRWRGNSAPSVQEFIGHDVTFAYVLSEHMMGLREGDTVVLYALHWSYGWGHA